MSSYSSFPTLSTSISGSLTTSGTIYTGINKIQNDLVIRGGKRLIVELDDGQRFDLGEMARTMSAIAERLLVLVPDIEKHELYPALKSAYDAYRVVETLSKE